MIIGVSGKIGSGKDTIAGIIREADKSFEIKKFATKLKQIVALISGCKVEDLEDQDFKNSLMHPDWENLETSQRITYRRALQIIGTDLFRDQFHKNVWINALFADYTPLYSFGAINAINLVNRNVGILGFEKSKQFVEKLKESEDQHIKAYPNWIITDVRFVNEAEAIKKRGGIIIRVDRKCDTASEHESETALDNYQFFDYYIDNNSSLDSLRLRVLEFFNSEKKYFSV